MLQRGRPRAASCNLTGTPNDILCPSYRNTFEAAAPSWQRSGNVCFGFVTVLSPKSLPDLAILSAMRQNDVKQNAEITNTSISQVLKCPCDRSCAAKRVPSRWLTKMGLRNPPKWTSCQLVVFCSWASQIFQWDDLKTPVRLRASHCFGCLRMYI